MNFAHVKNWREFQHYTGRCPPWIKLQRKLLDDYEYACLPLASKALAPLLWLLASESTDGSVRIDVDWLAFRLRWSVDDVKEGVTPLIDKGFLIIASDVLAPCKQDACLEGEGEGETEGEIPNLLDRRLGVTANADDAPTSDESVTAKDATKASRCPIQQIVGLYHEILTPPCPRLEKLTPTREGYLRQRWREDLKSLDEWRNYFTDVKASVFLTGRAPGHDKKPPFIADLEWLTRPSNFAKVSEGKYHR